MTAEPQDPAVMEFGDDDPADDEPRRNLLRALLADPRLVLVCAGLAGLAAFGSMIGEWITIQLSDGGPSGSIAYEWRMGVNGAGALGSTYLIGVLVLATLLMLTISGPVSARRSARIAGLGAAGTMLAVVIAVRTTSRDYHTPGLLFDPGAERTVLFGRGLTLAYLVPILAGLAFLLAARIARHEATVEPAEARESAPLAERPTVVDWAWRRPRQATGNREEGLSEPPPLDLTVKPATPFAHPDPSTER
jgi:hypothetical protein